MATEGELLAGDHTGVVWQQCGSGLGDDPPVRISPDASLVGILAWAERLLDLSYSFLRDNPEPNPGALYPSGIQAAMSEPTQQLTCPSCGAPRTRHATAGSGCFNMAEQPRSSTTCVTETRPRLS